MEYNNLTTQDEESIRNKILTIRGVQVILDSEVAKLYNVSTKVLNQAVKRNISRFPDDFLFQLTEIEVVNLKSQTVTSSSNYGGRRYLPYVFTEQGIAMLSGILRSKTAIKVNIAIMRAFVLTRKFILNNACIFNRLDNIEKKNAEYDDNFEKIFEAIESKEIKQNQGVFFDGQIFDSHKFVSDLVRSAKNSIILIDNYIDDSVLSLFTKNNSGISVAVYTKNISKQLQQDLKKYNSQYKPITIKEFNKSHDRFLIIDNDIYHFGASLKDLGKKWFAFSKLNSESIEILKRLN